MTCTLMITCGTIDWAWGDSIDSNPKLPPLECKAASDAVNSGLGSRSVDLVPGRPILERCADVNDTGTIRGLAQVRECCLAHREGSHGVDFHHCQ